MPAREMTITADFEHATLTGFRDAVLGAADESLDVTWVTRNGTVVAAIMPARNYHHPDECCCQYCPHSGDHRERGPRNSGQPENPGPPDGQASDGFPVRVQLRTVFTEARQWTPQTDPAELARWCRGWVYAGIGIPYGPAWPPGELHPCIGLRTSDGSPKRYAEPGDWIIRQPGHRYEVLSAEAAALKYQRADDLAGPS